MTRREKPDQVVAGDPPVGLVTIERNDLSLSTGPDNTMFVRRADHPDVRLNPHQLDAPGPGQLVHPYGTDQPLGINVWVGDGEIDTLEDQDGLEFTIISAALPDHKHWLAPALGQQLDLDEYWTPVNTWYRVSDLSQMVEQRARPVRRLLVRARVEQETPVVVEGSDLGRFRLVVEVGLSQDWWPGQTEPLPDAVHTLLDETWSGAQLDRFGLIPPNPEAWPQHLNFVGDSFFGPNVVVQLGGFLDHDTTTPEALQLHPGGGTEGYLDWRTCLSSGINRVFPFPDGDSTYRITSLPHMAAGDPKGTWDLGQTSIDGLWDAQYTAESGAGGWLVSTTDYDGPDAPAARYEDGNLSVKFQVRKGFFTDPDYQAWSASYQLLGWHRSTIEVDATDGSVSGTAVLSRTALHDEDGATAPTTISWTARLDNPQPLPDPLPDDQQFSIWVDDLASDAPYYASPLVTPLSWFDEPTFIPRVMNWGFDQPPTDAVVYGPDTGPDGQPAVWGVRPGYGGSLSVAGAAKSHAPTYDGHQQDGPIFTIVRGSDDELQAIWILQLEISFTHYNGNSWDVRISTPDRRFVLVDGVYDRSSEQVVTVGQNKFVTGLVLDLEDLTVVGDNTVRPEDASSSSPFYLAPSPNLTLVLGYPNNVFDMVY